MVGKSGRRFFVGGNVKANGTLERIKSIIETLNKTTINPEVEVVIAPPTLYLLLALQLLRKDIKVAAQNISDKGPGAYTGEIVPQQLKDAGIEWVILGDYERRSIFGESDVFVASKTRAAVEAGLNVILCCGESLEEREKGVTTHVVTRQLGAVANAIKPEQWGQIVVAYQPFWAFGTGKVATTEQAQETHAEIRKWLGEAVSPAVAQKTRILYGGSVTDKNSPELAKQLDVDGFLVGGACLKPRGCSCL